MTKPAMINGVYADLKTIRSRSCVQIVVEVPIERGAEIVEAFGFPQPASEVHVVIARMANGHAEPKDEDPKREFRNLPRPQQAALACKREAFQRFMYEVYHVAEVSEDAAAAEVRETCHVRSRSDLGKDADAARWWDLLYGEFEAWMRRAA